MRRLVIGDIHNNYKALKQVIERSNYDYNEDLLIFLGDYVDGYSHARKTIDFLLKIQEKSKNKPIFLMGNHDLWFLNYLKFGTVDNIWLANGGDTTYKDFNFTTISCFEEKEKYFDFFNNLYYYYLDDDNNAFVHAGFYKGLGKDDTNFYIWDRELWDLALEVDKKWKQGIKDKTLSQYKEIFIGHTTTMNWFAKPHYPEFKSIVGRIMIPMNRCNVWNLDTGAGYRGRLTIMDIDSKEYWQSDNAILLYPNERGR